MKMTRFHKRSKKLANLFILLCILALNSVQIPPAIVQAASFKGILPYHSLSEIRKTPVQSSPTAWVFTGAPNTARGHHTAILIPNGKVLLTGVTHTMDFFHSGVDSSVHVVDQIGTPNTGVQAFYLPAMTNHLAITANGVVLNYTLVSDPSTPDVIVNVNVPANTTLLKLEYDQLDSAIAFEGLWYLAYSDWIWGPLTMTVHLPNDASVKRYEGASYATMIDSHTIQFNVPNGVVFFPTVIYDTTNVPQMYDTIMTTHFRVFLPSVYRPYQASIISLLENAYTLYGQYSSQDENKLKNQMHYDYYFPPGGWYWWGTTITLWGGLTVEGGPSAVQSEYVPSASLLTTAQSYNPAVSTMLHELGNGWWTLWGSRGLPWWIDGEVHSAFLRSRAELDLNYCPEDQRQYIDSYQQYLQCRQDNPAVGHCSAFIILTSLLQKYGWPLFRKIYADVQSGTLNLNGLSDSEKDSQMILYISRQVNENLVDFFASQWIYASTTVQQQLNSLPVGNVPIISSLTCVPLTITGNAGTAGATLSYTDGVAKTATSLANGNYSLSVPYNWSGTVTPTHACFTFNPTNKVYGAVTTNQTGQDYTPTFNAASGCANMNVLIGGTNQGKFGIPVHSSTRASFGGVNNGPVLINGMNSVSLIGAERVIYAVNGVNTSFSEMMALPDSQLNTTYWLPWYNNVDLDTQLRFGNVSSSPETVHVFIGGSEVTPLSGITLAVGASTRVSYASVNNGPVKIVSDQNIVAAERVIYKVNNVNTSFSEMMALPNSQLNTTYWLPWYNNVDLDTQLRIGNVSSSVATVHVFIGGSEVTPLSGITLAVGASTRVSYASVNNGPVKIMSDQNIVAAERVIYKVNNVNTSFSEMMALPNSQLNTTYWLPWYNNVDLDTQLRFGNVSSSPATVHVFIGGAEVTPLSGITLAVGASTRVSYASVNNGSVQIVGDQNIVASERVIYKVNTVNTSFSEMMALPNSLLNTTYWLPWYNNVDLDTQLRFGVP